MKRKISAPPVDKGSLDTFMAKWSSAAPSSTDAIADQIATLKERREMLQLGKDYIDANLNDLRGKFTPQTPTQVSGEMEDDMAKIDKAVQGLEDKQTAEENNANRAIMKRTKGGYAGDGNCYISFVNVGLGDCTIITTPLATRIMIDCGSDSLADVLLNSNATDDDKNPAAIKQIQDTVNSPLFLDGSKTIHMLLLTHSDKDHHEKMQDILAPLEVSFGVVYYGGAETPEAYTSSEYLKLRTTGTRTSSALLRKVKLREEDTKVAGKIVFTTSIDDGPIPTTGKSKALLQPFAPSPGAPIVLYYEDDPNSNFKLSIIAANCTGVWKDGKFVTEEGEIKTDAEEKLRGTDANKGSLMVLVECFGQAALICGDATAITEYFAVKYFNSQIGSVDKLRMGHHGSPTSSSLGFIQALGKMETAVASTSGKNTRKHRLPKKPVLDNYVGKVGDGSGPHSIYGYEAGSQQKASVLFKSITNQLFTTGSCGTYEITRIKSAGS